MASMDLVRLEPWEERRLRDVGFDLITGDDASRWRRLAQAYASTSLWLPQAAGALPTFGCESAEECSRLFSKSNRDAGMRADHRGTVANYFAAGYDRIRTMSGVPVRVCVVSTDSGGWTFDFKTLTGLDKRCRLDFKNQHWRETRKLLHYLLLGEWPSDLSRTLLTLKLFTHVRALKCNGGDGRRPPVEELLRGGSLTGEGSVGGRKWDRPPAMFGLCVRHLDAELAALEPTVIVAQGYAPSYRTTPCATWSVVQAMNRLCNTSAEDISSRIFGEGKSPGNIATIRWEAPWGSCVLLGSYHPSSMGLYTKHGEGALDAGLKPSIKWLRALWRLDAPQHSVRR